MSRETARRIWRGIEKVILDCGLYLAYTGPAVFWEFPHPALRSGPDGDQDTEQPWPSWRHFAEGFTVSKSHRDGRI